jgi:voltage-gated potassium channel Kch
MKKIPMDLEEARKVARNFRLLAMASIATVLTGTAVFHYVEDWSLVDSLYFSVVSLTTVGYGDLTPATDTGKLLVVVYLLIGIGIIAALINNMFKGVAARNQLKEYEKNNPENHNSAN